MVSTKGKKNQESMNVSNYQKKIEELKLQSKEKESFIKSLKDELYESKEIINSQRKKINEIEEKTKNYFSKGDSMNQNMDYKIQFDNMKKENEDMKAKLKKTLAERDIMKKTNDKLMKQIKSDLKGENESDIIDKISQENQKLQTQLSQYESECIEKDTTIKDLKKKIRQYENDSSRKNSLSGLSKQEKEEYDNKIRELEVELGRAEGQLGSLEGTIMMHEEENIMLKEENATIKKQIDILKTAKELKGNMGSLKKKIAKLEQQLEQSNKTNQEAQNTIKMLKKQNSEINVKEKAAPFAASNNEEVLALKEKIEVLKLDLEVAELGVKEKDAALVKQEQISKDYQKKINDLQRKVNEGKLLEDKLVETSNKLLKAENELNILKDSSFEATESSKKYRVEQENANKEIKKYKDISKSLMDELEKVKHESAILKQQIIDLENERKTRDVQNSEADKNDQSMELEKLKEKIDQSDKELNEKKVRIEQLTKELEDVKVQEAKSLEDYTILKEKMEENQKEVITLTKRITELTQEINEARENINQYEKELKEAHETIRKLENELKEGKEKWEDSIRTREVVLEAQNEQDNVAKLQEENKRLYNELMKEKESLAECQKREQNLLEEANSFGDKLKQISHELNEKSILSDDLTNLINQLQKEKEISERQIEEKNNKLVAIQEQLDATIRERDEKLIQYNYLERQLQESKKSLEKFKNNSEEDRDTEFAIATEQIKALKNIIMAQEDDLSRMYQLEKEKKEYEGKIKQLQQDIERIQNSNINTGDQYELEQQAQQFKITLDLMKEELSQKNIELETTKKNFASSENSNRELKEKLKDYEAKVEEISLLKENMKDYKDKEAELEKLRISLKNHDETIEELKKLKESVKDYDEKIEELNQLRVSVKDYNEKVEELNQLKDSLKDYDEKVEELNRLKEMVKDYDEKMEAMNSAAFDQKELENMRAMMDELEQQVKDFNDKSDALEERDNYIKELETTIKNLEESKSREITTSGNEEEIAMKDKEIEELKGKCAELEITTLEDQLKIKELEDSLTIQQDEFESLESSWDELKSYVSELEKEIEISNAALNEKKEKLAVLEEQVESLKKKLEDNNLVKESARKINNANDSDINIILSTAEMNEIQPFIEKIKTNNKNKNDEKLSQLIILALSSQEKEINNLKSKLDQSIHKLNNSSRGNSVTESEKENKEKIKKLTQDAECLREQNLQLAKELAETKSQYKAREIEVEKITDSLFNQISTLENEFVSLEEDKNSIMYDFKQYKFTVLQEMKQLVEKHSTEEEKKQLELETKQREENIPVKNQIENDVVGDTYKVFIDKLDESLTKKDREIVDMNITMNENKKEIDYYKNKLIELEKVHHELLQADGKDNREVKLDLIEEKIAHIKNLELSLGDAMDKIKVYETSQASLKEQNQQLSQELEKVHHELLQADGKENREVKPDIIEEKNSHIKNLELSLKDATDKIKNYETSQGSLKEQNQQLSQELEKAHRELHLMEEKIAHIENLELSLSDAMNKVKSYETSQASLKEQNQQLSQELEKAQEEMKKLIVAVEDAKRSETAITREITATDPSTSEEILDYQQKLKAANEEVQTRYATINEQKEVIDKLTMELNQLRGELEKTTTENFKSHEILKDQIINLNQKLADAKLENQNQKRTISELEQAAARISASNINAAAAGGDFPMKDQAVQQLKGKIEFLQNRIEVLQKEKKSEEEASKNNIETAKARIAAMENLMIAYRNKIAESNKKALTAETQIQEQSQEIDRLYSELDIAHSQLQEIERQVGRCIPSEAVRRRMIQENPSAFYESPVSQIQNQSFNEEMFIKHNVNRNSVEIMSDNVVITKNHQLETDPLVRDCMNIFSSLDDVNVSFNSDFMMEKDSDVGNNILNASIIEHTSFDSKSGVISSSKDQIKLNEKDIKSKKDEATENVVNGNEMTIGVNKIEEITLQPEDADNDKNKENKNQINHESQSENDNEHIIKPETITSAIEGKDIINANETVKSPLQPIMENKILSDDTLKTDDIISAPSPPVLNENINGIKKNRSIIRVFKRRSRNSKKQTNSPLNSENSILSSPQISGKKKNSEHSTSTSSQVSGKKKKKSFLSFLKI